MAAQELMVPASEYDALIDTLRVIIDTYTYVADDDYTFLDLVRDEIGLDASWRLSLILDGARAREIFGT